jgi:hypothetical protein
MEEHVPRIRAVREVADFVNHDHRWMDIASQGVSELARSAGRMLRNGTNAIFVSRGSVRSAGPRRSSDRAAERGPARRSA